MVGILFIAASVVILFVTGELFVKYACLKKGYQDGLTISLITPLIGLAFLTCLTQLLNLLFPVKIIAMFIFAVWTALVCRERKYIGRRLDAVLKQWKVVGAVLLVILIVGYPLFIKKGLYSIQYINNDIILYLSSMDWLKTHTLRDTYTWSVERQFYAPAWYMLTCTRFGTDEFGCLLMSLFNLEAHQVFSCLCVIGAVLGTLSCGFISENVLHIDSKYTPICMLLMCAAIPWNNLLVNQYAPQILGIALLLAFWALCIRYVQEKEGGIRPLISLTLIATLTVYAEYAQHLLGIYLICIVVLLLDRRKSIEYKRTVVGGYAIAGILAFVMNPVGLIIAAKFNFSILNRVVTGVDSIDAYRGRLLGKSHLLLKWFGLEGITFLEDSLPLCMAIAVLALLILVACFNVVRFLRKQYTETDAILLMTAVFFLAEEFMFRRTAMGYQEYKLLTTAVAFFALSLWYYGIKMVKASQLLSVIPYMLTSILVCSAALSFHRYYQKVPLYYFDDELAQVSEMSHLIPQGTPIEVRGSVGEIHGLMYALRDSPCFPGKSTISNFDYWNYGKQYPAGEYVVQNTNYVTSGITNGTSRLLWSSNRYVAMQRCVDIQLIAGFSDNENDGSKSWCWTTNNSSEIEVKNYSPNTEVFHLELCTAEALGTQSSIVISNGEDVLGQGKVGETISTAEIRLAPGESLLLDIYSEGELYQPGNGDMRTLGIMFESITVKQEG